MANRVAFLIDGFNVYHSVKEALRDRRITRGKWLNYKAFCESMLRDVVDFPSGSIPAGTFYFTALAQHCRPDVVMRHRQFIKAVQSVGTEVVLGNFKRKTLTCRSCNSRYDAYEEKETDVNIAVFLIKLFIQDRCDTAVLVTGDTDLVAAVTVAKELFPYKKIAIAFPYKRHTNHFKTVST
jgi:uncharacterized LabA/DUF88 family protein